MTQGVTGSKQIVNFSDKTCVSKTDADDPGYISYSLTLKLTNEDIIVTGPEEITIECSVPVMKEVPDISVRKDFN